MKPDHTLRILVIDDSLVWHKTLVLCLAGFPGVEAIDGARNIGAALALSRIFKPNLVILDAGLPNENIHEAVRLLRAQIPGLFIIAVAVEENPKLHQKADEAGVNILVVRDKLWDLFPTAKPDTFNYAFPHHPANNRIMGLDR